MTSPRERLLATAADLVRQHGVAGTGLSALLAQSGTARGSVYQHFPGGKDELIEAATDIAAQVMRGATWASLPGASPADLVRQVVDRARAVLEQEDFSRGCPVVAAALAGPEHGRVVAAAGRAFATWTEDLAAALVDAGLADATASSFANVIVSAVEGAVIQSRAQGSLVPLDAVASHLGQHAAGLAAARTP